ncbi:MAG TPA: DUF2934 domain-containing protein [Burkholderiales bacterium]|nr:DUF2934 domain-containing protein [Burkholderiales bacterium]
MARKQPAKPRPAETQRKVPSDLNNLIAEAAYYRAQQRGFTPGHELDDWVAAETEVRRRLEG